MKRYAVIVAGGKGLRFGAELPKQFLQIKGRPLLFYTLDKFLGIADEIILVLPETHFEFWNDLKEKYNFHPEVKIVRGGDSRTSSVINGLNEIEGNGLVAIHDAVRPLVSRQLIEKLYSEATIHGNSVPGIPVSESLRIIDETNGNKAVNRANYIAIQTPQCFDFATIKSNYQNINGKEFSDDASVYENAGGKIHIVTGESTNIKITYKEDIFFAEGLL